MTYLRDRSFTRQRDKQARINLIVAVAVLLILFFWGSGLGSLSFVAYPLAKISNGIRSSFPGIYDFFAAREKLSAENGQLKAENEKLKGDLAVMSDLEKENADLRRVTAGEPANYHPILADIIAKPGQIPYDTLILDAGTKKVPSLKNGSLAFLSQSIVLGQIFYVSGSYSKLKLFSSDGQKIPVLIGDKKIPAVASGLGGGNFLVTLPRGQEIKIGDSVKTAILGDYLLATVVKIDNDPNSPFQKDYLKSPFNINELGWVELSDNEI